ncbi:MAG: nucleoside kinase [Peptostreptococcaceae bacterium]|nr:nucleoside kinase [Peptostreptococcaceae bacterium]
MILKAYSKEYSLNNTITIENFNKEYLKQDNIVAAIFNNNLRELTYELKADGIIKLLDFKSHDGKKIYMRSLSFLFIRACKDLYPNNQINIEHAISKGLYCEINGITLLKEDVDKIKERMNFYVKEDFKIIKKTCDKQDAIKEFERLNNYKKAEILKYKKEDKVTMYEINGLIDYFYGYMVPSTSYLKTFDLQLCDDGVVIIGPNKNDFNKIADYKYLPKLSYVFRETEKWAKIMNVRNVSDLNKIIENNKYSDLIRTVEALHEKKISEIADMIDNHEHEKRLILIAGPSSSGKTSFSHRLATQLKVNGLDPVSISLDNYFVNREDTPLDEFGKYDFESIYSIDLELFNTHLQKLLKGEEIELPVFNFKNGKREYNNNFLKVSETQPIIIEGIHGLNEMLTESIPHNKKFKIYVSALTQLNLDEHNRIQTTDLRLIRRMVRDKSFRNKTVKETIAQWKSVRRGEEKYIFPYQEEADIMFNSTLIYELSVLKKYAKPLLENVKKDEEEYIESNRLLKFLQYFVPLEDEADIPPTSILKEFIGGSRIVH